MNGVPVTHFYFILWLTLIFASLAIVLLFDWYYKGMPIKDVEFGKYMWHVPVLLILTASIGFALGLGILQLMGIFVLSSFPIMIGWSIAFAILHGVWLIWRSRLPK